MCAVGQAHQRMNYTMITRLGILSLLLSMSFIALAQADEPAKDSRCYELRVYTAGPGKLDALNARFRDHTCKLFEKHGMTNVGYWTPLDNPDQKLYYILSYPDRDARKKSWAAFMTDPEWLAAYRASEKDGRLAVKVESTMLHATDYSPAIEPGAGKEPRIFELRTYTCTPQNLKNLDARFRDHTIALFSKHGMQHFGYWWLEDDQKGAADTLVYLLAHKSKEASESSFQAFRDDPKWIAARDASEKAAGGSLTAQDGVKSVLLVPTDYSPTK